MGEAPCSYHSLQGDRHRCELVREECRPDAGKCGAVMAAQMEEFLNGGSRGGLHFAEAQVCPNCRSVVEFGAEHCEACGHWLEGGQEAWLAPAGEELEEDLAGELAELELVRFLKRVQKREEELEEALEQPFREEREQEVREGGTGAGYWLECDCVMVSPYWRGALPLECPRWDDCLARAGKDPHYQFLQLAHALDRLHWALGVGVQETELTRQVRERIRGRLEAWGECSVSCDGCGGTLPGGRGFRIFLQDMTMTFCNVGEAEDCVWKIIRDNCPYVVKGEECEHPDSVDGDCRQEDCPVK
jgi:hypothetical protein